MPPYSPDLNPVATVRACLRANKLAITVFGTYAEIVNACCKAWTFFATDPKVGAFIISRAWAQVS